MTKKPFVIVITGPTASGKSALAEQLALYYRGQIINADVGQFYTPLTIGTAKPDWKKSPIKHHLFDVVDTPKDISVVAYRSMVVDAVDEIQQQGAVPIVVGGSLFYIQSLFFPPKNLEAPALSSKSTIEIDVSAPANILWNQLNTIDPTRAQEIHINDRYRIVRALTLWQQTGKLPSACKPLWNPPFNALVICLNPERATLAEVIKKRTHHMLVDQEWMNEAKKLFGTPWQDFVVRKGFIGYKQLFDVIEKNKMILDVEQNIIQETVQYAKRQLVFWKKFKTLCEQGAKTGPPKVWLREYGCLDVTERLKLAQADIADFIKIVQE